MANFNILMPKLGESIQEGTITKWFVKEGDTVEEDDMLFEVATDKVDSEIPSPVDGVVTKILFPEDSLVPVGEILAVIKMDDDDDESNDSDSEEISEEGSAVVVSQENLSEAKESSVDDSRKLSNRFYSPLVKTIAKEENISLNELETIKGSGANGRVQKKDILEHIKNRGAKQVSVKSVPKSAERKFPMPVSIGAEDQVIEMDRVRKLIADHMVMSKQVAPHVTSVVEADVTELVIWRNKNKDAFQQKHGDKITFMPIFTEAVASALSEFPLVNSSVDGDKIIIKKDINVGIAVAKPDGNLIVPVIKNTDQRNLVGLAKELNRLANAARTNKLSPADIEGGTFTITNFGSFRNIIGTPIINQPQVAILATGSIEKKPAVLETPTGDVIAIRHKMYLSLSYDHRIVDGALGGAFLRRIADILEEFDINRSI
ncbi:MAG: 2-oxo acid dehydrogenase subunit E2 [Draconibacterium sp.]|nr:2-oxo acid dehydrogenase subunit E2 [Draconibacterium sp.]